MSQEQRVQMEICGTENGFDYYSAQVTIGADIFRYYFEIQYGWVTCYYNNQGVCMKHEGRMDFEIYPGFDTPRWAKGAVMYQIYVDRFLNGDPTNDVVTGEYHYIGDKSVQVEQWNKIPAVMGVREFYGGDLQGIMNKLDYLQDLGVEVIYLNPIFVSPSNHKYDCQDYDYVDPHYGRIVEDCNEGILLGDDDDNSHAWKYIKRVTDKKNLEASNELFAKLTAEIHRRGMKIILDGVFNHCGSFNKWMDRERIYENQEQNSAMPMISFSMRTDSLFFNANETKLALGVAGIKAKLEKKNDSLWIPRGIVGFDRLLVHTPEFGLPLRVRKTAVTVDGPKITLRNASLKIGHSDMVATGEVMGLYRAMTKNETLKARLAISSEMIDCNQLINSFSLSEDSVSVAVTDTVSPTEMKLFVLPGNLDFELQTDLKKVVFEKVEFEDVCGKVDLKNRTLYLRNLEMRALDADMKAVMVYRADSVRGGYTGFDFKIRDINIAKLVDFIPSMDTIVPMLRSFEGRVQFDVAAEARLDSNMNIRIPTLRSAMYIKGDSLVLMDGETFAEISKMLMFKNKRRMYLIVFRLM